MDQQHDLLDPAASQGKGDDGSPLQIGAIPGGLLRMSSLEEGAV
jgi:hypothetical protein